MPPRLLAEGENDPVPELVQVPPLATETFPDKLTAEISLQVVMSVPAVKVGAFVIVRFKPSA